MLLAPFPRKVNLLLPLAKAVFICFAGFMRALVAGNTVLVFRTLFICGQDRAPAGIAQLMRTFLEPVPDGDPRIKDETLAIPFAIRLRHFFKVFQDAAFQVVNIFYPLAQ